MYLRFMIFIPFPNNMYAVVFVTTIRKCPDSTLQNLRVASG